jgi:hypothetical protein
MVFDALDRSAGDRVWRLSELADRQTFDRYLDTVATAIADRFALKVHVNVAGRWRAYNCWIAKLQDECEEPDDYHRFVRLCADLVESLASQRVFTYSAMMRDVSDPMTDVVLAYPNAVTALATGSALYIVRTTALTGAGIAEPLAPAIAENAAAALQRHPQAAAERFRELLRLTTPWDQA